MDAHKFRIGQSVTYRSRGADAPQGLYVIIALLPQREDGELEYRIKHSHEHHQRSAKESELRPPTRHESPTGVRHTMAARPGISSA